MVGYPSRAATTHPSALPAPADNKGFPPFESGQSRACTEITESDFCGQQVAANPKALRARTVVERGVGLHTFDARQFQRDLRAAHLEVFDGSRIEKALQEAHRWADGRRPPIHALSGDEVSATASLLVEEGFGAPGRRKPSDDQILNAAYGVLDQRPMPQKPQTAISPPPDTWGAWPAPPPLPIVIHGVPPQR